MTDRPAEPTTEELIQHLMFFADVRYNGSGDFKGKHREARPINTQGGEIYLVGVLFNAADQLATLTAAKEAAEKQWRCFHCGEVFTDSDCARVHFGDDQTAEPACRLNEEEGGIAAKLRQAEHELEREDRNADRQFYAMLADHATAVRRAEEDGHGKGVRDMNTQLAAAEKQCEKLRRALEQIRDGYLGDQTAEAQFIWAQGIATSALAATSPKEGT